MTVVLSILIIVVFILAFAGLVVPLLPDVFLLLAGFLIFHFFINDEVLTASFWWTIGFATVFLIAIDYIASGLGARQSGASKWSFVSAALGVLIFPFILGPVGIIVGPFVAVVLTELLLQKTPAAAVKSGIGTLAGFLGGIFVKGLVMLAMVGWFVWLVFV